MPGYKANFLQELQRRHQCRICSLALRVPMQTECGHLFCKECVEPIFRESQPLCPVDQEPISREDTFPDNACKREILGLSVYCDHKDSGCEWTGELKKLEAHLLDCRYREIQCTQCGQLVPCAKLENHERNECPMRPSVCEHCLSKVPVEQLEAHIERVCPKYLRSCPNGCNEKKYLLFELQQHLDMKTGDCPLEIVDCPYSPLGCSFKHSRKEIEHHLKTKTVFHAHLHVDTTLACKREATETKKRTEELIGRMSMIESKSVALDRKLKSLESEVERAKGSSETDRLILKVNLLEEKFARLQYSDKTNFFSHSHHGGGHSVPSSHLLQQVDQLYSKVSELDTTVTQCISNSMETDMRLQFVERASYNGTMLWRIDNFSQHKQEAIDGTTLSLYSVPFYTSKQGYKMCARVYLNGDGLGKGTHLSLFFVVMRGPYDALLPWPFEQKVTLVLLNQTPGKRNIVDQFRPDPQSSSFQRPVKREMNIASGCPRFCRLEQLKDGYIKDDCIFLGIIVDTSNLKLPVSTAF